MEFLSTAFYVRNDLGDESLNGAVLTSFDELNFAARPSARFVSKRELIALSQAKSSELVGFNVNESGVLFSDTPCRKVFSETVSSYITDQLSKPKPTKLGLIDALLAFNYSGCFIVQNYEEALGGEGKIEPRLIPMSNFRVSNSSFNVYAPYKKDDGRFRTMSLVDITSPSEEVPDFYVFVPDGSNLPTPIVSELLTPAEPLRSGVNDGVSEGDEVGGVYYKVSCKLTSVPIFMGEGFINYLAFNVGFYDMGLKVALQFLADTKYNSTPVEEEKVERGVVKKPYRNVAINSNLKVANVNRVLSCIKDPNELAAYVNGNIEAMTTLSWIKEVFNCDVPVDTSDVGERVRTNCLNIQSDVKKLKLRCALELLAQRYYLAEIGPINDPLPEVLKGGGVLGYATKEFTW